MRILRSLFSFVPSLCTSIISSCGASRVTTVHCGASRFSMGHQLVLLFPCGWCFSQSLCATDIPSRSHNECCMGCLISWVIVHVVIDVFVVSIMWKSCLVKIKIWRNYKILYISLFQCGVLWLYYFPLHLFKKIKTLYSSYFQENYGLCISKKIPRTENSDMLEQNNCSKKFKNMSIWTLYSLVFACCHMYL